MMKHPIRSVLRQVRFASPALVCLLVFSLSVAIAAEVRFTPLDQLLDRTGKVMTNFLVRVSEVKCSELVTQIKLGRNGKVEYQEGSTFDYLILPQTAGDELTLVESRLVTHEAKHKRNLPLLVTNGFSTLVLVFHPYYQPDFEFNALEDETLNGSPCARVQFRHLKGMRSTAVLLLRGREYPLDFQGVAWIDRRSGEIAKIKTELESGMDDVGLKTLRSEVEYAPVTFQGSKEPYWLPTTAYIEVESARQHWRNIHRFTAYQRFSTSVQSTLAKTQ